MGTVKDVSSVPLHLHPPKSVELTLSMPEWLLFHLYQPAGSISLLLEKTR
jgi:hypothetical protein